MKKYYILKRVNSGTTGNESNIIGITTNEEYAKSQKSVFCDYEEVKSLDPDDNYNYVSIGHDEVERILKLSDDISDNDLKDELLKPIESGIIRKKDHWIYYKHVNTIFLNILLNREDEVGEKGVERSLNCRKLIVDIIKEKYLY